MRPQVWQSAALRLPRRFRLTQQGRQIAGVGLPAPHRDVDVGRVNLKRSRLAAGPLGCDQDGAAAAEGIEHQTTTARAILDRVRDQCDRLDGRVHRQFFQSSRPHGVDTGIVPDVRPITPVLSELKIIDVRGAPGLPYKHQLVLRAVK